MWRDAIASVLFAVGESTGYSIHPQSIFVFDFLGHQGLETIDDSFVVNNRNQERSHDGLLGVRGKLVVSRSRPPVGKAVGAKPR